MLINAKLGVHAIVSKRRHIIEPELCRIRGAVSLLLVALVAGACAAPLARNGVPNAQLAQTASIPDLPGVRAWSDEVPEDPISEIVRRTPNMPRMGNSSTNVNGRPHTEILALSGGGADGAFGAGVLTGWSERGDRPEFEIVTGVSAGAIIAPFAFLGSAYDSQLRRIWTEYQASDVVTAQLLPGLLGGASLTDTTPMAKLIAQYITEDTMRAVAEQYKRGRILLVLTTNLDAQRPVVWNMGEIAHDGSPKALQLFRDVIRASAAIPGVFPPVKITVEANGKIYDELHVDGGTTREVFVLPVQAPFRAFDKLYAKPPKRQLYIIKNGRIGPEYEIVEGSTFKIAGRSIATLIKNQNIGELYRIYRLSKDDDVDFNLTAIPKSFDLKTTEYYDPKYQKALFEAGVVQGRSDVWMKVPPGQRLPISAPQKASRKPRTAQTSRPAKASKKVQIPPPLPPRAEKTPARTSMRRPVPQNPATSPAEIGTWSTTPAYTANAIN